MWARIVEAVLGLWLLAAPFLLEPSGARREHEALDVAAGALVIIFALLSFLPRLRRAHLATLALSVLLFAVGFSTPYPPSTIVENEIIVALTLLMLSIVPSEASKPPRSWRMLHEPLDT